MLAAIIGLNEGLSVGELLGVNGGDFDGVMLGSNIAERTDVGVLVKFDDDE